MVRTKFQRRVPAAFTLVELLVVIAIIGVLVALLLPAVQAAREAARRSQCINNLKNVGVGWLNHESTHKALPSAGWNAWFVGDPELGTGRLQPGGWIYNILPFIEQQAVYDLPGDGDAALTTQQRAGAATLQRTPAAILNCPTRRPPRAFAYALGPQWNVRNSDTVTEVARSDYAANAGDGGGNFADGDDRVQCGLEFWIRENNTCRMEIAWLLFDYNRLDDKKWPPLDGHTGVNYLGAEIELQQISDGMSNTYMVGEKYVNADFYESDGTADGGDNHSMYQGYDWDVNRWATNDWPALPDTPGFDGWERFGSAHAGIWNVVMCDGSVQSVSFDMDNQLHQRFANREDGLTTDGSAF